MVDEERRRVMKTTFSAMLLYNITYYRGCSGHDAQSGFETIMRSLAQERSVQEDQRRLICDIKVVGAKGLFRG